MRCIKKYLKTTLRNLSLLNYVDQNVLKFKLVESFKSKRAKIPTEETECFSP